MAQSSNDSFPSAMYIATAINTKQRLVPRGEGTTRRGLRRRRRSGRASSRSVAPICRMRQPLTLGQEWSGYGGACWRTTSGESKMRWKESIGWALGWHGGGYRDQLCAPVLPRAAAAEIAKLTGLPFCQCTEQVYGAGVPTTLWYKLSRDLAPPWPCRSTRLVMTSG